VTHTDADPFCRFETKIRKKNAPECTKSHLNFKFFSGVTPPDPRHWGLCLQTPGEGKEGREGKEKREERRKKGRGNERKGKMEGEKGKKGREKFCVIRVG
jgi:hypothetical protein